MELTPSVCSAALTQMTALDASLAGLIEQWRIHCNTIRPHNSLGYGPPAPPAINPLVMPASDTHNERTLSLYRWGRHRGLVRSPPGAPTAGFSTILPRRDSNRS